jgi:hypothetical protein
MSRFAGNATPLPEQDLKINFGSTPPHLHTSTSPHLCISTSKHHNN